MNTQQDTDQVMIDIETLSTHPNAAILSIGAVLFNIKTQKITGQFEIAIRMESSPSYGHISPETVSWWMQRPEQARQEATKGEEHTILGALNHLEYWIKQNCDPKTVKIWSKSPAFDLVILASAYRRFNKKPPWHYHNELDVRTAFHYAKTILNKVPKASLPEDKKHIALEDAHIQAKQIMEIYA